MAAPDAKQLAESQAEIYRIFSHANRIQIFWLLMETDPDRARDVKRVFTRGRFREVESTKGGELKVTRVIVGRRPA